MVIMLGYSREEVRLGERGSRYIARYATVCLHY
jgi:hypothetical protein